jgi:hypothetical protein
MGTADNERVWMASLHLEGIAVEWYYALERDVGLITWPRFTEFVNMRFGLSLHANGLVDLKDLRRTDTVEEYQRQFLILLYRCDDMMPLQQVHMFTVGLGEPLRTNVELAALTDLQTAMRLAQAYERRLSLVISDATKATSKPFKSASSTSSSAVASSTPRSCFRRLSQEELAVKRENGECYHCTEKFMPDHKCKSKGVFLLEMDNDSEPDTAADELGISLHALIGIDIANTMKLQVRIKGTTLVMLVDTGSTHTFIKEGLLPQLGLSVTPREGLTVKVANDERVTNGGVCRATDMDIGSEHFSTNFYVLPLDGFDIVLGI